MSQSKGKCKGNRGAAPPGKGQKKAGSEDGAAPNVRPPDLECSCTARQVAISSKHPVDKDGV
eukprot:4273437-Amphidinium_carterae.1